jgi:hypothetical protein
MREKISSSATPFIQRGVPGMFLVMAVASAIALWTPLLHLETPDAAAKLVVPFAGLLAASIAWLGTRSLRTVWIEDGRMIVGTGAEEWLIPLSAVEDVRERRGRNGRRITVDARGPTGELVSVRFIPAARMHGPFTAHPIAAMLREQVHAARAIAPGR